MLLHRKRVPSFTTTGDGLPGDPVNVALVGTLAQLRAAFAALGWSEADRLGLASSWGMIRASTRHIQPPRSAPSICSAAAKTSGFRRQSATVLGSGITSGSGP